MQMTLAKFKINELPNKLLYDAAVINAVVQNYVYITGFLGQSWDKEL